MKKEQICKIAFLLVGLLTVLEYVFVRGMFTSILMMCLSVIVGLLNIALACKDKDYHGALLYALTVVALNMGYILMM